MSSNGIPHDANGPAPFVSIVIPCYNFGHLLPYTLNSILQQTYTDWEAIVVDDGSKDNTEAVMAGYVQQDARIRYHKQKNGGPAKARNTGIQLSRGKYLQFLDADDLLQPNKLLSQVNVLKQHPDVDVIYAPTMMFYTSKQNPEAIGTLSADVNVRPLVSGSGEALVETFLRTTFFPSASLMRLSVVNELQCLDEKLIQAEDWDLYLRAAHAGAVFKYLADVPLDAMALIRKHDSNNTTNFYRLQYYVIKMRQKFAQYSHNERLLQLNRQLMMVNLEDLIFEIQNDLANGKRRQAIERSFKAYRLYPTARYLVYAFASIFVPARWYTAITRFSFSSIRKGL